MSETVSETHAREKAYDFIEDCLRAGWTWEQVIRAVKQAWVGVHDEKAHFARQDAQKAIQP